MRLSRADKMVVQTDTERVLDARKLVIEFLLSDHPYDCMTCEKSGSCKLEKYAYELGIRKPRFVGEKHDYPVRATIPFSKGTTTSVFSVEGVSPSVMKISTVRRSISPARV